MARPSDTLLELAACRLTGPVRAVLLASAVVTLAACRTPTAPDPADDAPASYRPSLGGAGGMQIPDRTGGDE